MPRHDPARPSAEPRGSGTRERAKQQGAEEAEREAGATEQEVHRRARRGERARAAWGDDYEPAAESEDEELWGMCVFADTPEWEKTL